MTTPVEIADAYRRARRQERQGAALDDVFIEPPEGVPPPDAPRLAELVLTRSALTALPSPQPLVGNVLDLGTQALLYGRPGSGKSFIALDWAASVATGRPWQGRKTTRRRVLYVAAEGAFGFKGRVSAWEVGWQTDITDDDLHILPRPVNLTRPVEVGELRALIDWGGYGFVIIDTLARCMVGGDENSAGDCGRVVDALHQLREQTPQGRGVILGVHHTTKDGRSMRGSSAFEGGADTVYSATLDGQVIVLNREKRKDGVSHDTHELKIDPMPGTDSAVISVHRGGGQSDRADKLMSTFVQNFSTSGASKTELRLVSELSQGTFYRALDDLLKSGEIINEGTDQRPFYKRAGK